MGLPEQNRRSAHDRFQRQIGVQVLSVGLAGLGIALIVTLCWSLVPPIATSPDFFAQFTVTADSFYAEQPAKTLAYELGCVATPFLLALAFLSARHVMRQASPARIRRLNWTAAILYLALTLACAWPMIHCPNPPVPSLPPSWLLWPIHLTHSLCDPFRIALFILATGTGCYFFLSPSTRAKANRVTLVLLIVWLCLIPERFYAPGQINDNRAYTYHLNSLTDAMSQSINGHHWLVDFPHIYGGYGELMAPLIRLFPRGLGVLIGSLAVPNIVGALCLLLTARMLIPRPGMLFVTALALLGIVYAARPEDLYYGYGAARFFFPALGLISAVLYFHRRTAGPYALTTFLAAVASIWNMDTGVVFWGAWVVSDLAAECGARQFLAALRHLLGQILALAGAWIALFIYLRLASGSWADAGLLFHFQKLVTADGYSCVRAIVPDVWVLVLILYLAGLTVALAGHWQGRPSPRNSAKLLLSILGIGLFSYFMGRCVPTHLAIVAYPAALLVGIFCTEAETALRRRMLPPQLRLLLLPATLALFWWAFLFVAELPELLAGTYSVVNDWNRPAPWRADAAFIQGLVHPQEKDVYILSGHSGLYYYLSGTARSVRIPGVIELLDTRDMNTLVNAIQSRSIPKLFVDQNFFWTAMYRPEIYQHLRDVIRSNYKSAAVSPSGQVVFYLPR